jgi:hypothetical protein
MSKRRNKRVRETAEEFADQVQERAQSRVLEAKADENLFTVDRDGSKTAKKKIAAEVAKSQKVPAKVQKLVAKSRSAKQAVDEKTQKPHIYDMWGDVEVEEKDSHMQKRPRPNATKAVKVAIPGQSYNPSAMDHENAVAEAAALELQKKEKEARDAIPVINFQAMQEDALVTGFSDDESSDEDEEDEDADDGVNSQLGGSGLRSKIAKMKTRAQRNRKKRVNAAERERLMALEKKKLLKGIEAAPRLLKDLEVEEKYRAHMKKLKEVKKQEAENSNALKYADAGMVPLSDELNGSLRLIKPKGSRIKEQTSNMVDAGKANAKDRRKRKAYEKPHQGKKVVWIPKYKYK